MNKLLIVPLIGTLCTAMALTATDAIAQTSATEHTTHPMHHAQRIVDADQPAEAACVLVT